MDGLALVTYAAFLALAFGWRTLRQWQMTGDTGLRLEAQPGTVQWWAKVGLIVAVLIGIAAPVAGLAGFAPLTTLDRASVQIAGLVLAIAGIVLTLVAQLEMGPSWRIGVDASERTALVTTGVFARVRNPIFTAMLVASLGLMFLVGNVIAVAGFVVLVVALEVQVRSVEEPYLCATHGASYINYADRAGRFVPGIGHAIEHARS